MSNTTLSIAITGAGGAGVISCGDLLLRAWARQGGRGLLRKAFGPQIRGGESAALLKLTEHERYTAAGRYDLLLALDWDNFSRLAGGERRHTSCGSLARRWVVASTTTPRKKPPDRLLLV